MTKVFIKRFAFTVILVVQVSHCLALCQAFFAPDDNLTDLFIQCVDAEQKSIHGAMYMFTDKKIAQALVNAKKRGVDVQLILDQISMAAYGKGKFLQEQGIFVLVHRTFDFNAYTMALMHHKFFVFGCNRNQKPLLWTGSWNCTVRATTYNDENVLILDDEQVIVQYQQSFDCLKARLLAIE